MNENYLVEIRGLEWNLSMKTCTACKEEKPFSEFYKNKGGKFGLNSKCKYCYYKKSKEWVERNREKVNQKARENRTKNPERHREAYRRWRLKHKSYDAFRTRTRNAIKKQACPKWADLEKIKEIYNNCPDGFHVDHIIPLRGEIVSGLHCEFNLQYLPAIENIRKKNYYENHMV